MLVLTRQKSERVVLDFNRMPIEEIIRLHALGELRADIILVEIRGDKIRLGIEAAKEVPVHRQEVYDAIQKEKNNEPET